MLGAKTIWKDVTIKKKIYRAIRKCTYYSPILLLIIYASVALSRRLYSYTSLIGWVFCGKLKYWKNKLIHREPLCESIYEVSHWIYLIADCKGLSYFFCITLQYPGKDKMPDYICIFAVVNDARSYVPLRNYLW